MARKVDFEIWLERVDEEFIRATGMGRDDFPDQAYWDMWDDGFSPRDAMAAAIESEYGAAGLEAFNLESVL